MITLKFRNLIRSADDQLGEEAAEWLMRYREVEPDPEDPYSDPAVRDDAFLDWTARSPNHLRMFIKTIDMYQRLGQINPEELIDMTELLAGARREIQRLDAPVERVPSQKRRGLAAVVAAAVAATVGALLVRDEFPNPHIAFEYTTAVGERQTVPLPDGSVLTLNTHSRVSGTFDGHTREVRLIHGEALFQIKPDTRRPFHVLSDTVLIEDLGTEFDVNRQSKGATVSVIAGHVRLYCDCSRLTDPRTAATPMPGAPNRGQTSTSFVLSAGEQGEVVNSAQGALFHSYVLTPQELESATVWRTGKLNLSGMTLTEAVEQVNRYTTRKLVVADPAIADLILGGTSSSNVDVFLENIKQTFGVEVLPADPSDPDPNVIRLGRPTSAR